MSDQPSQASGDQQPSSSTSAAPAKPAEAAALRPRAVMAIVVPVAVVLVGGVVFFGFFDGANRIANAMKPSRAVVTGRVFFNGEPLADAEIFTRPVNSKLRGAIGWGDKEGRFSLKTELGGDFLEGAYVGEHLVTVKAPQSGSFFGPPPLATPEKYASFETSPFRITVTSGPNEVEFNLEGEPPARRPSMQFGPQRPPGAGAPGRPGGGRGPGRPQPPETQDDQAPAGEENAAPATEPAEPSPAESDESQTAPQDSPEAPGAPTS